jgi:periplasmic protein CpxP/Spy
MTRKVFYIGAAVAVVVGLLSWGIGYAYRSPERRMAWVAKRLNLDEQQTAKLQAVHEAVLQAREQFHKERAELFEELAAQIKSEHLDEAKVLQFLEQRQALMTQSLQDEIGNGLIGVVFRSAPEGVEWHSGACWPGSQQVGRWVIQAHSP